MEASFRSRLDRTFGFLNDAQNDGDTHLWSVEERAASMKNKGLSHGEGEGDSDDDDDEEAPGCADFLKSETATRRNSQGERLNSRFFGEEDLEELESGDDEEEDDGDDDDDDDEDEDEQMRIGKKKKGLGGGEETATREVVSSASGGGGERPLEPLKDVDDEEREVREMVGMDDTLDFEDEEDEYDKVAVGTEGFDDRLFMSQVRNFGASRQQLNPLPTSFIEMRQASRDRRANHKAALARLEEDDREAATQESQATEEFKTGDPNPNLAGSQQPVRQDNGDETMDVDGDGQHKEDPMEEARIETQVQSVSGNLESALVREGKQRKPGKRVRFSTDESNTGRPDVILSDPTPSTAIITRSDVHSTVATPNRYSKVPDYVKNPSKYIHYTLDWSEEDEEQANMAAFHAARVVSSSTSSSSTSTQQDMVTEEALVESQESTKISFNPLVTLSKRSFSQDSGRGVAKDARGMGVDGVVNVVAKFDMDANVGGLITMEDDQEFGTSSDLTGQGKSSRVVVRRYRNRVAEDIETD